MREICKYCGREFPSLRDGICENCKHVYSKVKEEVKKELLKKIKDKIKNL